MRTWLGRLFSFVVLTSALILAFFWPAPIGSPAHRDFDPHSLLLLLGELGAHIKWTLLWASYAVKWVMLMVGAVIARLLGTLMKALEGCLTQAFTSWADAWRPWLGENLRMLSCQCGIQSRLVLSGIGNVFSAATASSLIFMSMCRPAIDWLASHLEVPSTPWQATSRGMSFLLERVGTLRELSRPWSMPWDQILVGPRQSPEEARALLLSILANYEKRTGAIT